MAAGPNFSLDDMSKEELQQLYNTAGQMAANGNSVVDAAAVQELKSSITQKLIQMSPEMTTGGSDWASLEKQSMEQYDEYQKTVGTTGGSEWSSLEKQSMEQYEEYESKKQESNKPFREKMYPEGYFGNSQYEVVSFQFAGFMGGKGFLITSPWGKRKNPDGMHKAIDIRNPEGAPVYSVEGGTVIGVGEISDKNNPANGTTYIKVKGETTGNTFGYFHTTADTKIKEGAKVSAGQQLGKTDQSGRSNAPHLHFTVENSSGNRYNPVTYFQKNARYIKIDYKK